MDNKFDDKLKNILSNPPEFPVDEGAKSQFLKQLYTLDVVSTPKRKTHWGRTMLWLALLFLAGGIGYLFSQNQNLKAQLLENKQGQNSIVLDTVIEKHVTVVYDTIYISKENNLPIGQANYRYTNSERKSDKRQSNNLDNYFNAMLPAFFAQKSKVFSEDFISNTWQNDKAGNNNSFLAFIHRDGKNNSSDNSDASDISSFEKSSYNISLLDRDEIIYPQSLESKILTVLQSEYFFDYEAYERKAKKRKRRQMMQPQSFALGIHGGFGKDLSLDFYDVKQSNYILGIDAEIGFGKKLALVIGVNYRRQNFKVDGEYDNQPISLEYFPPITPQDIDDELHEVYWRSEYLEIPFGFKYSFLSDKRIQPYFGLGLMSRKALSSKVTFEYYATGGGEYKAIESGVLSSEFKVNNAWGTLGAQFKLTKNWKFFLEGGYQFDWKNKDLTKLDAVQILQSNAGILYQF